MSNSEDEWKECVLRIYPSIFYLIKAFFKLLLPYNATWTSILFINLYSMSTGKSIDGPTFEQLD